MGTRFCVEHGINPAEHVPSLMQGLAQANAAGAAKPSSVMNINVDGEIRQLTLTSEEPRVQANRFIAQNGLAADVIDGLTAAIESKLMHPAPGSDPNAASRVAPPAVLEIEVDGEMRRLEVREGDDLMLIAANFLKRH